MRKQNMVTGNFFPGPLTQQLIDISEFLLTGEADAGMPLEWFIDHLHLEQGSMS